MIKVEEPSTIKTFKQLKDREPKSYWFMTSDKLKEFVKELSKDCPYLNDKHKDNKANKENE